MEPETLRFTQLWRERNYGNDIDKIEDNIR